MKIFFIMLLFLIYSCSSGKKKELTEKEKQDSKYEFADIQLSDQKEKIALLASIENVAYDTLYLILKDYYAMTSDYSFIGDSLAIVSVKTLNSIARTYNYPSSKVASVIFTFKYEMQTKEDIIDNLEREAQDALEQEEYDPRY